MTKNRSDARKLAPDVKTLAIPLSWWAVTFLAGILHNYRHLRGKKNGEMP